MIDELERLARRTLLVPLAFPLFLLVGFSMGDVATLPFTAEDGAAGAELHLSVNELEGISATMADLRESGNRTTDVVALYQEHVAPIERVLRDRGVESETAKKVAWPLVENAYRHGLDPATVIAIMWVESRGEPLATSPVGARGLMQIMPWHSGRWVECDGDMYDVATNLCYGTSILAGFLNRYPGNERRALLGYNGCIRGTNTPDCWRYPDKVWQVKQQVERELAQAPAPRGGVSAASP